MPKFKIDSKVISISFLMEKIWMSPNILRIWLERNNKITNQIDLPPERRLMRH